LWPDAISRSGRAGLYDNSHRNIAVRASILEPSLVFLTGTFKTKGSKQLRSVKVTPDVLRSGQDNQRGRNDNIARPARLSFMLRCVRRTCGFIGNSHRNITVRASTLEPSLVFLTGTFKTKGSKQLRSVKVTPDVLRSGQDNQRGRNDNIARPARLSFMLRCVRRTCGLYETAISF